MQHITIMPMTINDETLRIKRRQELVAWRCLASIVFAWLAVSVWALAVHFDRVAQLTARV
jgi:hypothetical protein